MSQGAALAVEGLVRRFGDFTAVDDLTFEVARGEVFGFLGPNGAGKSTTIRMLCGLLAPTEGEGHVAGLDINTQPEEIKQHIGYMSQRFSLYETLSVLENMEFYGGVYGVQRRRLRERIDEVVERLGLGARRDQLAGTLSTGVRQRLALGCAILHEPELLFLDEPTSGVDPLSRRSFFELIGELREAGATIFVTTHVMDEAEMCTRLGLIRQRLIALGTPRELKGAVPGETIEVTVERPGAAMEALQQLPEVADITLSGGALHVRVREQGVDLQALASAAGVEVQGLRAIEPTLETAFIALVEKSEGAEPS